MVDLVEVLVNHPGRSANLGRLTNTKIWLRRSENGTMTPIVKSLLRTVRSPLGWAFHL